jgi:predicted GIY-YIG superfamily endonuclease
VIYVYVFSNRSGRLCAGTTRHIQQHLQRHHDTVAPTCTHVHQIDRLLLLESYRNATLASAREEQINRCSLTEKVQLIRTANPKFEDLTHTLNQ